jgi:peptidoglycan/xylan/chitin deacetylase (PgdA/CDA1 family)/uncharacterized caspase-like protein
MAPRKTPIRTTMRACALVAFSVFFLCACQKSTPPVAPQETAVAKAIGPEWQEVIDGLLAAHRKIIVLFADDQQLSPQQLENARIVGQAIFHENIERVNRAKALFATAIKSTSANKFQDIEAVLSLIESDPVLFDADRLAFKEVMVAWRDEIAKDSSLRAVKLRDRIDEDVDALQKIEKNYDKEFGQIFSRFEGRSIVQQRELWSQYVARLKATYTFDQLLQEKGIDPAPAPQAPASAAVGSETDTVRGASKPVVRAEDGEIVGYSLPPKVIALTFDDGPHHRYTKEIAEILQQHAISATFFQVGNNVGKIAADGRPQVGPGGAITQFLENQGHTIANHTMSHAQLSKLSGEALSKEILHSDAVIKAADPKRSPLFRFPYGAKNKEATGILSQAGLRSVMWNIDSLDWADPIPSSIADRVMRSIDKEGRGVVLFHDIHERTLKALPMILNRLVAEGYQFARWDGQAYSLKKGEAAVLKKPLTDSALLASKEAPEKAQSWAVVIGIDEYKNSAWPTLRHAVNDASALKDALVSRFGYQPDHIVFLKNQEATRENILSALNGSRFKAAGAASMKKSDNLLVFFAGHGSTRKLSSGRDLGYIIPVDATQDVATDAIPMSELQNISESVVANHAMFIMDACYSGLGLTRGASSANFLRDNNRRVARQMLTAGGADQMVADGGPAGHSIFTWTLLQALDGKADFNGDNVITGTELAAYIAPAVSSVSNQTPAFGSLPGSEGGEFVFQMLSNDDYINEKTPQLSAQALALNQKIDSARATTIGATTAPDASVAAPITVALKSLDGKDATVVAVQNPSEAQDLSPKKRAQLLNEQGMRFYKEAQYAKAQEQFAQALKILPDYALAANNMGFVHHKQGQYAEAIGWFQMTLKIDPYRAIAHINLGDSQWKMGDTEGAKKSFAKYLELAPNGPSAAHAKQMLTAP